MKKELVTDGYGLYAHPTECIHGNKYYAYVGHESDALKMGYTETEINDAPYVDDFEDLHVDDCCG